jgi:hypothetical protein
MRIRTEERRPARILNRPGSTWEDERPTALEKGDGAAAVAERFVV